MMHYRIKYFLGGLFIACLLWFGFWKGYVTGWLGQQAIVTDDVLVVGTNVGYPPFIMTNEHGQVTGFDYDVAKEIAQRLGKKLMIRDMAFDALLIALAKHKVAMIIGGFTLTSARKRKGMLWYYGDKIDALSLLYKKGKDVPQNLYALSRSDLQVCTQTGSSIEEVLASYEHMKLKVFPEIVDTILEIQYGRSDICVMDVDVANLLTRKHKWLASHHVELSDEQQLHGYCIGVADPELKEQVERTIARMHTDGTMQKIAAVWFD